MGRRLPASGLTNTVHAARARLGLSQQELARRAGITRQAVNAIEAGRYTPNTIVSLRLARALGCRVEDLFRVPDEPGTVAGRIAGEQPRAGDRVVLGRVGSRLVSHPVSHARALPEAFAAADGIAGPHGSIELFVPHDQLERTAFVVGCDPSLGMLADMVTRRVRDARLVWIPGSSRDALDALHSSTAHVAGIHLRDARSGECNLPQAKRALAAGGIVAGYAAWEQGFVTRRDAASHPVGADALAHGRVRLVNREPGSGSRALLDRYLHDAGVPHERVAGYGDVVRSHVAVAREVAAGRADTGIALRAVAEALGLDFAPITDVKFDLLIPDEHLTHPAVEALLDVLQTSTARASLAALPGYDSSEAGMVRARFGAAA